MTTFVLVTGAWHGSWCWKRVRDALTAQGHAVFTPTDREPLRIEGTEPQIGSGLGTEAAEVQRCLAAGLTESPLVPHGQTLTLMRQMDEIRAQIGVVYPDDATGP